MIKGNHNKNGDTDCRERISAATQSFFLAVERLIMGSSIRQESLSFSVPSVTTTLTGFGTQVKTLPKSNSEGMLVIERLDCNDQTL